MLLLICMSGLFSGLTLGLMSFDESQLRIIMAGDDARQRLYAERILPIRRRGNLLLCTLLLGNTLVNSLLAILIDGVEWLAGPAGVCASTGFILVLGEIIPQAFCARHGLAVGYYTAEIVKVRSPAELAVVFEFVTLAVFSYSFEGPHPSSRLCARGEPARSKAARPPSGLLRVARRGCVAALEGTRLLPRRGARHSVLAQGAQAALHDADAHDAGERGPFPLSGPLPCSTRPAHSAPAARRAGSRRRGSALVRRDFALPLLPRSLIRRTLLAPRRRL